MNKVFFDGMKTAVNNKRSVQFTYDGLDRRVSPYMLGQNGSMQIMLHALQTAGFDSKGPVETPVWKFFDLAKIASFAMDNDSERFVQIDLRKTEGPYVPPKFITQVFALHKKE